MDAPHLLAAKFVQPIPPFVAEAFVRYDVGPHFQLGVGARYWGIFTDRGAVQFGPTFSPDFALTKFSTQRYGVLFEAKASF